VAVLGVNHTEAEIGQGIGLMAMKIGEELIAHGLPPGT